MTTTSTFEFSATGYGERATAGSLLVAQTGNRYGSVPGRAVALLAAGDWAGFVRLYRRSNKLRLSMTRHLFAGDRTEIAVGLSYGSASLGAIRLPVDAEAWEGMGAGAALALVGLDL
jgi:hypothetical protein